MTIDRFDYICWILGVGVISATISLLLVFAVVFVFCAVKMWFPRLNFGAPRNDGEICFYDHQSILTGKNGERIEPSRRMINAPLQIKWWFGFTHRPRPAWFVGIIRWQPKP